MRNLGGKESPFNKISKICLISIRIEHLLIFFIYLIHSSNINIFFYFLIKFF